MEFFTEQVARAELSYRLERRRGQVGRWARTEGRTESLLPRRARRRRTSADEAD